MARRRQPSKPGTQAAPAPTKPPARGRNAAHRPARKWVWPAVAAVLLLAIAGGVFAIRARGAGLRAGPIGGVTCRGLPLFAQRLGFGQQTQIDTSDTRDPGLQLVEQRQGAPHVYRHPSWSQAGFLGAYALDRDGTIYVAPAPQTSLLLNPPEQQNRIYRVDAQTGEMRLLIDLPAAQPPDASNPYGVLGMALDCDTHSLYVTSVSGSTRSQELGRVFRVDIQSAKVADSIDGVDAFGAGIFAARDGRRLYLGYARQPGVAVVPLDSTGNFDGAPQPAFTVADRLTAGDGRVRRIGWSPEGMLLTITPFSYTLVPPLSTQHLLYAYNEQADSWSFARSVDNSGN